jgi:DNA-nicking Smr family endonuclease
VSRPRAPQPEELLLWAREAATAVPLKDRPPAPLLPRLRPAVLGPPPMPTPVARPSDRIAPQAASLDGRWDDKLRSGTVAPDLIIDLHGMSREHAYAHLERQLQRAHARQARLVVVVTGKGKTGALSFPAPLTGILRAALPGWLETPALRPYIAAVRPAHARHGGTGAFYVVLRRARPL